MTTAPYTRAEEVAHLLEVWLNTHDMKKHALVREAIALLRTTPPNTAFQLTAEDLSNLGGAMGSETTTYRPVGLYAMKEMAKVAAQRHYNDRAGRNPKVLEWRETIGGVSSKDMGFVMYHIRERKILS